MSVVNLFQQIAQNDFGFFQQVKTVADIMTADPATVTLDDTFRTTTDLLKQRRCRHAIAIDPDSKNVVGVVSDRDLRRFHPRLLGKAAEQDGDQKALENSVTKFMTRNPVWCRSDASPVDAINLMLEHHIDSVLVSNDGKTMDGILTPQNFINTLMLYHRVCTRDSNLRRLRLVDLDFSNGIPLDEIFTMGAQTVRDVMTKDVQSLGQDEPTSVAIAKMQEAEIRHLPVVNSSNKLVGMLSDREILHSLPVPENNSEQPETKFRERLFATDDKAALHQPVDSAMDCNFQSVNPGMLLTNALAIFENTETGGVPVVDPDSGALCGILTTSDIIRVFRVVMQLGTLAETPPEEPATA